MKKWAKVTVASLGLAGAGVGLAFWSGSSCWDAGTARAVEKLKTSVSTGGARRVSFEDFDSLPAPVARYFRFALKDGQPSVRAARIRHAGEFSLNGKWVPFESRQHFSTNPPAFVWDAKMRMNPLASVRVRDGYLDGRGSILAKVLALFTVADSAGGEHLASGALQRYLAEAAWLPTALLPGENLKWSAIDDRRAMATLTDAGLTASLEFEFNEGGEIAGVFSPARYKEVNGEYKPFPWAGRFWDYAERGGMMIPLRGEVEWRMPEGAAPYWRGLVVEADYDFAG